jgi:hypothetical protein
MGPAAILLPLLAEIGAPILKNLVQRSLGDGTAGVVATTVIDTVSGRLGIDPTADAIVEAYQQNPKAVCEVVRSYDKEYVAMVKEGAKTHREYLDLLREDQQSDSPLSRVWRPLNGVLFGAECALVIITAAIVVMAQIPISDNLIPIVGLVVPVMTVHAGVVGYYVGQRTKEKIN